MRRAAAAPRRPAQPCFPGAVAGHRRVGQNWGMVSEIFDPGRWREVPGFAFTDVTYHRAVDSGTVRVAFNRPEVRNAFRPHTVDESCTGRSIMRECPAMWAACC